MYKIYTACLYLILFVGRKITIEAPDWCSMFWLLKEKLGTRVSIYLWLTVKEKFYLHFLATKVLNMVTEKKIQSPLGACLKKLISDPALWEQTDRNSLMYALM